MKFLFLLGIFGFSIFAKDFNRVNNTIVDTKHNLVWQDDSSFSNVVFTWGNAIEACESLNLDSYDDWRLPNINELNSIVARQDVKGFNNHTFVAFKSLGHGKEDIPGIDYWSSTTYPKNKDYAYTVGFWRGNTGIDAKTFKHYIRCVRDYNE